MGTFPGGQGQSRDSSTRHATTINPKQAEPRHLIRQIRVDSRPATCLVQRMVAVRDPRGLRALPAPTAVTSPDADTVATLALDETHVAWDVTFCVVPSDIAAVITG